MSIQLFVPKFRIDETLAEIRECMERGWTGMGFKTVEIENRWKEYTGLPHAHFLNSATAALHLAFAVYKEVYGWQDGDEVITTALTFVSTNHAIKYENLTPVFADVDETLCLDPKAIERAITPRTRAVIYVGLGGNPGQLKAVSELCRARGLKLVLDAAHMAGCKLDGRDPGHWADCTSYSYQAVKNMPTADSGMICFNDEEHDLLARKLSWLGISSDTYARSVAQTSPSAEAVPGAKAAPYKWYYEVDHVGWKYNGNAVMAAMALVSLRYLDEDNARRREICALYDELLAGHAKIERVPMAEGSVSSRHLYQVLVDNRDEVVGKLNQRGVNPGVHYRDNTVYSPYRQTEDVAPNARRASDRILSLPLHMSLSDDDVRTVAAALIEVVGG